MPVDHIRYDLITQDAMRGVIRAVLKDISVKGLPGEHHFFITFDTRGVGVKLSPRLLAQYAEEMTIVLQHQFWDMTVGDEWIEVGLSFNGVPERLVVPFTAIKDFVDPSVRFRLQFAEVGEAAQERDGRSPHAANELAGKEREPAAAKGPALAAVPTAEPEKPAGGAEVVRLDRFRKK